MLRKFLVATAMALVGVFGMAAPAAALEATAAPAGAIESPSSGEISFRGGAFTIRCPLTLNGNLRAGPIALASGAQFGTTTEVRIGRCSGGTVERVLNLPWNLKVETILPAGFTRENITGFLFRIERAAFQLAVFGEAIRCLYEGNAGALIRLTNRGEDRRGGWTYGTERIEALASVRLPLIRGGEFCPASGTFSGRFELRPAQVLTVR